MNEIKIVLMTDNKMGRLMFKKPIFSNDLSYHEPRNRIEYAKQLRPDSHNEGWKIETINIDRPWTIVRNSDSSEEIYYLSNFDLTKPYYNEETPRFAIYDKALNYCLPNGVVGWAREADRINIAKGEETELFGPYVTDILSLNEMYKHGLIPGVGEQK